MARRPTSDNRRRSRAAGPWPRLIADQASTTPPPLLRLTGSVPMTTAQQQRFGMLFDALIAHWLSRTEGKRGKPHD